MTVTFVTTTIHVPTLLESYMQDAAAFNHRDVSFIVVGDRKTPIAAKEFCRGLGQRYDYETIFLDVGEQENYLRSYPELADHLPYDSIQRRNVGLLLAYERGADVIITIDDDNYLAEPDFISQHSLVGQEVEIDSYSSEGGWLNVCDFLVEERGFQFYHRGFPLGARSIRQDTAPEVTRLKKRVAVNAGFWFEEPDVDAVTRLAIPVRVTGFKRTSNFALGRGTWSPFNSQNTALHGDVIPAYFLSPHVGRYDDIWASYVVIAITDHLGEMVVFGHPFVRQERNAHDYWIDLDREKDGMRLTDRFCEYLRAIKFAGRSYLECYSEAIGGLEFAVDRDEALKTFDRALLAKYIGGMKIWKTTMLKAQAKRRANS